jgi:hypothetical protein
MVLATRHWLAGTGARLDSLLLLFSMLQRRRRWAQGRSRLLGNARIAIEGVLRELREAADDMDRGLRRSTGLSIGYHGCRPVKCVPVRKRETAIAILKVARERMAAVRVELDVFLVQLLVFGRSKRKVGRWRLARAKRSVRAARDDLEKAQARVERMCALERRAEGEAFVAREAS